MNTQNKNSPTDKTKNSKYAFVQRQEDDFTCIKLLSDEYKGIIYKYDNVKFEAVNDDGQVPLQFKYLTKQNTLISITKIFRLYKR